MFSEHFSDQAAGRDAPRIPVQTLIKSGSAGLDELSVLLLVAVKFSNGFSIGPSPGADRQQEAVLTISNHLRYAAGSSCNDRQSEGIRLAEHQPETLVSRRQEQKVRFEIQLLEFVVLYGVVFIEIRDDLHPPVAVFARRDASANRQLGLYAHIFEGEQRLKSDVSPFSLPVESDEEQSALIRSAFLLDDLPGWSAFEICPHRDDMNFFLFRAIILYGGLSRPGRSIDEQTGFFNGFR